MVILLCTMCLLWYMDRCAVYDTHDQKGKNKYLSHCYTLYNCVQVLRPVHNMQMTVLNIMKILIQNIEDHFPANSHPYSFHTSY